MKNYSKHLWGVFSVALNIGFIVAAVFIYYHHPSSAHHGYLSHARILVKELRLPASQQEELSDCLERFEREIYSVGGEYHQIQTDILTLLSAQGDLDMEKLDEIYARQGVLSRKKRDIVRNHLVLMRKLLGNEKSAQFFPRLLKRSK